MNKQQLASTIWQSANQMRSKIEANEYKDYILGFMFYKYLSDREVSFLKGEKYSDEDIKKVTANDEKLVKHISENIGYFIAYEDLFSTWLSKGDDFDVSDVRDALSNFDINIEPTYKKLFENIFKTLQSGLSKLGETSTKQTKSIKALLKLIKRIPMDGKQDYDVLGFIYEYLISMFAANAGKKAGEFYTPHEVSVLMSEIVANHLKDREHIKIYDPTSGSGSLLINIGASMAQYIEGENKIDYYAQELKENTYNLTRMNLVMRGINPANINVRNGDTLEDDWPFFETDENKDETYSLVKVDAVVSNPPYSQKWDPKNKEFDPRFKEFGVAPKAKADYAFLLHELYHLEDDGIMTIILPHGVLFRGGEEETIRKTLIERNHIEAIIGLPANIFFGTGIPTIIMVLKRTRSDSDVLIIDASKKFEKAGKNNKLRARDIREIVDTLKARKSVTKFAKLVTKDDIRKNEYNLNIPRYVDSSDDEEPWDIHSIMFGGIPNMEIENLRKYWDAFPGLREEIFGNISDNYANPNDPIHLGKEISLKIYDRQEIALGQSRYQIVQQPKFKTKSPILNSRRGDLMLLINGMPVIHLELKRSGIPVSEAYNQIEKYSHEGVFRGIFSLVQIFVAMQPKESVYFANPGEKGVFNKAFYFHWADFNNNPINEWYTFIKKFLSIPMAHMLIGFYTIADTDEGILKVMRSYQYYAAVGIANIVAEKKSHWDDKKQLGGHVWHTTGSGKTMTSFKAAQLVAANHDADKVVFLVDRKELGIQSLKEYRSFATGTESVQATENTDVLISKLKSPDSDNTLIVTSIQKLSNIAREDVANIEADLKIIQLKRMVIIIDECHRSTFGDMLVDIKNTFKNALIFGFTGTPIQDLNAKKDSTTPTIFGDEIHRYTLGDGIRDKNVLGFDPYMVRIYDDADIREKVALSKAKAKDQADAFSDPKKEKVYLKYMDSSQIKMHGELVNGKYVKGIEDFVPNEQYQTDEYVDGVIQDIKKKWTLYSRNRKFHAIFATSSIPEAVKYYRLMVKAFPDLFITAMFDPTIDNEGGGSLEKEDGIVEILEAYNKHFNQKYTIPTYDKFRKEVSLRLSHKKPFDSIGKDEQIDILIVVNQMLTGFDSKFVNTLYLDKMMEYENLIQAFSRTNRLYNMAEKPFGIIKYYRRPNTMEKNIEAAVKAYSGDVPTGLFVDKLPNNLRNMNVLFQSIEQIFKNAGIVNFEKLPADNAAIGKFAKEFNKFVNHLEAAIIQGFTWNKNSYPDEDQNEDAIKMLIDNIFLLLIVIKIICCSVHCWSFIRLRNKCRFAGWLINKST